MDNLERVYSKFGDMIFDALSSRQRDKALLLIKAYQTMRIKPTLEKLKALYDDGYVDLDSYNELLDVSRNLPVIGVSDYIECIPTVEEIKRYETQGFLHISYSVFLSHTVEARMVSTAEFIELIEKQRLTGMEFDLEFK